MSITRNFKLFLTAGRSIPLLINANQYDHGETWVFTLYDETGQKYTPSSGAIVGIKSDGYVIADTGTVNAAGQVVIIESEQMTAAAGKAIYELEIDGQTHGTANFCLMVEPKPGVGGIVSDSDLALIQQALDSTSPEAIAQGVSDWMDDNLAPEEWVIDSSLSVAGAAADAKKTGDEISALNSAIASASGLTVDIKSALMNVVNNVAWVGDDPTGQTYITALYNALYPPANLSSISCVYTQGGTVYTDDSLDSLKSDLVVTAHWSDNTTSTVASSDYTLSGTLTVGTSTITVSYGGKTTTFNVEVEASPEWGRNYTWLYKASDGQLLSARTDIVTVASLTGSESLSDGNLNIICQRSGNQSYTATYNLVKETNTNGKLRAKFRINDLGKVNSVRAYGFRLQISNGTNGIMFYEWYNGTNIKLLTYNGTSVVEIQNIDFNTWYIIEVERNNGNFTIKLDDTVVYETQSPATYYCTTNRIAVQNSAADQGTTNSTNVDIAWIAYTDEDEV